MSELTSIGANVSLSLVSHTNAGKTTLARTLLARDIGEVRDAAHVTEFAEDHPLVCTPEGDTLTLWDTPGFGDSVRLVKRLRGEENLVGWFLAQVWDRFRDRAFYASQQAMKNVRERADVVLYLVNASETPESAGYIEPEMELLDWMGKPVLVLLNQLGPPREHAQESAELELWRERLSRFPQVQDLMPLDAFARCWVQEFNLLSRVQAALPGDKRAAMSRLLDAWRLKRLAAFDASMDELAQSLARIASMREAMPESAGVRGTLRQLGAAVGGLFKQAVGTSDTAATGQGQAQTGSGAAASMLPAEAQAAQRSLAARADSEAQASLGRLIELHGLDGKAQAELTGRIAQHFEMQLHVDERKAAVLGGAVSGALGGLAADVGTAGMTLGGGMLAGAVLGALAAAGAARGVNIMRGRQESSLAWSPAAMDAMVEAALLRYLAVAHFGRGRGQWQQGEAPPHWRAVVQDALAPQRGAWAALWQRRSSGADGASGRRWAGPAADQPRREAASEASVGAPGRRWAAPEADQPPRGAAGEASVGAPSEASVGAPSNVAPSTLQPLLRQAAADVLVRLYPAAKAVLGQAGASATAGAMAHATATPVTATSTSQAMPPANAA
jgi:50S ribosome-binding GTPase/Domain of unknown function (DUF3482)